VLELVVSLLTIGIKLIFGKENSSTTDFLLKVLGRFDGLEELCPVWAISEDWARSGFEFSLAWTDNGLFESSLFWMSDEGDDIINFAKDV
jgi:hypothetical protein